MRGITLGALRLVAALALAAPATAHAGAQAYEPLAASVQAALHQSVSDFPTPFLAFDTEREAQRWLSTMSRRLASRMPDRRSREEFLVTVHYEAKRAGLDPQLVLGLIQVESNFRKHAVSRAGARGYMQVMPFWVSLIGRPEHNLFHLRINLRYGCVILRHYLDRENGDLFRALGRYNGSLGDPHYPNLVLHAWQRDWRYSPEPQLASGESARP
ncbi:MAG TPA: lytic transglycosylase domain-containing protein [Burkholderiales bacterium]|nr:lytic transglycosylase domain-containing protein [Burkholderiales bacterium]